MPKQPKERQPTLEELVRSAMQGPPKDDWDYMKLKVEKITDTFHKVSVDDLQHLTLTRKIDGKWEIRRVIKGGTHWGTELVNRPTYEEAMAFAKKFLDAEDCEVVYQ